MKTYPIERRDLVERTTAVVRSTVELGGIGPFVARSIAEVARVLAGQGRPSTGPPFARYHRAGAEVFDVEVGFPTEAAVTETGGVVASSLPGGPAAVMTYVGPYEEMEEAYAALVAWVADRGGKTAGDPWEIYLSDPAEEPDPASWRTEIVMPFTG